MLPGLIDSHTHLLLDIIVPPEGEIARHFNGEFAPGLLLLESRILGAEHYAHTTFAQAFDDLVPAERLTDHGGCGMVWGNQRSRSLFRGTAPGKSAGIEHDLSGFEIAVHWQMRLSRMVGRPTLRSTPQD